VTGTKIKDNKYIIDFIEEICCIKDNGWYMHLLETIYADNVLPN